MRLEVLRRCDGKSFFPSPTAGERARLTRARRAHSQKTRPTAFAKPKPPKPKPIILPRPPSPSHPISPTSSTSHRKIPESLKPLLKVLREQAALGSDRPLCSHVGGELGKQFKGRFYLEKAGSFKRYVGQAEEGGWVRLGKGEKLGSEWIALV